MGKTFLPRGSAVPRRFVYFDSSVDVGRVGLCLHIARAGRGGLRVVSPDFSSIRRITGIDLSRVVPLLDV